MSISSELINLVENRNSCANAGRIILLVIKCQHCRLTQANKLYHCEVDFFPLAKETGICEPVSDWLNRHMFILHSSMTSSADVGYLHIYMLVGGLFQRRTGS